MFIVLLRFSSNMAQGGGIVALNTTLAELQARVTEDPLDAADIVAAEILEITPGSQRSRNGV